MAFGSRTRAALARTTGLVAMAIALGAGPPCGAAPAGWTRIHAPFTVDGNPVLGTYCAAAPSDIAAMRAAGMNLVIGGKDHLDPATPVGQACRDSRIRVAYELAHHLYGKARLLDRIDATSTDIPLFTTGATAPPASGVIQLDDELIRYAAVAGGSLTQCQRGYRGTRPAAHRGGVILFWPDACAEEIERVRSSPALWGYYVLDDSPGDALSALRAMYRLVHRLDPGRPVLAGYGTVGGLCNFGPGVCDMMMLYWYPCFGSGKVMPLMTSQDTQCIMSAAREIVPGIPFVGVYQTFDAGAGSSNPPGRGLPTAALLRAQIEDFVREGCAGLISFLCNNSGMAGWAVTPHLEQVVRETHGEIRRTGGLAVAAEPDAMRAARVQPTGYWRRPRQVAGMVPAWRVAMPFRAAQGQGLDAVFPPEHDLNPAAVFTGDRGPARWEVRRAYSGVVGLTELISSQGASLVAYAACEVISPRDQTVEMRLGSDDDMIVWLNGSQVLRRLYAGGLERDAVTLPVTLQRGRNRLLVKVHNRAGMWGFSLRFTETGGTPLAGLRFDPMPPRF